jgi:hypothetical protein
MTEQEFEQQIMLETEGMTIKQVQSYMLNLHLNLMDMIVDKKMEDGSIAFSVVEDGLLN